MEQKTHYVQATRYQLMTPISAKLGEYKLDGDKKNLGTKIVKRSWVLDQNAAPNNILWVIDEEQSAKNEKLRQENIKIQAVQKREKSVGMSDLIKALKPEAAVDNSALEAMQKKLDSLEAENKELKSQPTTKIPANDENQESHPNGSWSLEHLKEYCDKNSITYHHKAGSAKLLELINENK